MTRTAEKRTVERAASRPAVACSGVDHVVLYVKDPERSVRFYVDVLGMEVKHASSGYAFLKCGDQLVGLFGSGGTADAGRGEELSHLAFNVPKGTSASIRKALEARGIEVSGRRGDPECLYFSDPDGHRLQIVVPD